MNRRVFLLSSGSLLAAATAIAQQRGKVYRIGFLAMEGLRPRLEALRQGLREFGYVEGKNLILEARFAPAGKTELLDVLAAELVSLRVDVIVAATNDDIAAAKRATSTVPIVMVTAGEPIAQGSCAHSPAPGAMSLASHGASGPS